MVEIEQRDSTFRASSDHVISAAENPWRVMLNIAEISSVMAEIEASSQILAWPELPAGGSTDQREYCRVRHLGISVCDCAVKVELDG